MPVDNISRRPLMGMVQALLRPGTLRASSMRRTSSSVEIVSGVKWRKTDLAVSGAHEEYQVGTRRHSERGLRMTSVSSMDSGRSEERRVGKEWREGGWRGEEQGVV